MNSAELAAALGKARREGNEWRALCPAHADHDPSLSITERDGKLFFVCRAGCSQQAVIEALKVKGLWGQGQGNSRRISATYDYVDEAGRLLFQVVRFAEGKPKFLQRQPDGVGGYIWKLGDTRRVPYRLDKLTDAARGGPGWKVKIVEGEKDVDRLVGSWGWTATTNPMGADPGDGSKWLSDYNKHFAGADVVIFPDNDVTGRKHAEFVARSLAPCAGTVRIAHLSGLPDKGDISDWIEAGGTQSVLEDIIDGTEPYEPPPSPPHILPAGVRLEDFRAYMPMHTYIFVPSRDLWPNGSVNARLPPVIVGTKDGTPIMIPASLWLDQNRPVEQMTWAPGLPEIVENRLIIEGGWVERKDVSCFNLYMPPTLPRGDPSKAGPWLDHARLIYPDDAEHILSWLAHRVQRPQEKINHALILSGSPGIGKDTLLEPVKRAIGPWNFREATPTQVLGRFNGFLKGVILRISEVKDLGETDRYAFYEHMKAITAAPPDVLRCDEKHIREHAIINVCGVIYTTNYKAEGLYLPADDRRHYVAWSRLTKEKFTEQYWADLWSFFDNGGDGHVAAYLAQHDLSAFNPKAPPPKTDAFWDIVNAHRPSETAKLADVLDNMGNPDAVTLREIITDVGGNEDFSNWLKDRKNRTKIPHRFEECGYTPVRNPDADDRLWRIRGRREVVFSKSAYTLQTRLAAAEKLR